MKLQIVSKRFRRIVTQESPEMWHTVMLPNTRHLLRTVAFLANRIPRNTVISFSSQTFVPLGSCVLQFLKNHARSLEYIGLYDVNLVGKDTSWLNHTAFRPVFQGLSALETLSLVCRGHTFPPKMTLPPLPSLKKVTLDIKGADVCAAPDILGCQPSLEVLIVYSWRKYRQASLTGTTTCITPWLKSLVSLHALEVTMKYEDAHEIFNNEGFIAHPTITELSLNVWTPPSSYAFLTLFSNVVRAAVQVHAPARCLDNSLYAPALLQWVHVKQLMLKQVRIGHDAEFVAGLPRLQKVHLEDCGVWTLKGLESTTQLHTVWISDVELYSCEGIGTLTHLRSLCLSGTCLTDVSELKTLRTLVFLGLLNCQYLRGVPWDVPEFTRTLEYVRLCADVCLDMDAPASLPNVKAVDLQGANDGVGKFLESVVSSKATLKRLIWRGLMTDEFVTRYPHAASLVRISM